MTIFRRSGRQTTFVWAISLDGSPVKLEVASEEGGSIAVRIDAAGGAWTLTVDTANSAVRVIPR